MPIIKILEQPYLSTNTPGQTLALMPDRLSGIILESKSMRAIFQKKGKKMQKMFKKDKKRAKYLEIRAKMFKT